MSEDLTQDFNLIEVAENIFIEIDIVKKGYELYFDCGRVFEDLEMISTNLGLLLTYHEDEHNLYDIELSKINIPDADGNEINISNLSDTDKIEHFIKLMVNSKLGLLGILERKHFKKDQGDILSPERIVRIILETIDYTILRFNTILNKISK